jgi:hypothetical protein
MISGVAWDLQSAKGVQAFWDHLFIQGGDKLTGADKRTTLPSFTAPPPSQKVRELCCS